MSEFVDSINLIPLETNDSSLIRKVRELDIVETSLFVKDGIYLLSFDDKGNFLYSTRHLQGVGPQDYYSAVSFGLYPNGGLEIFDAARYKMISYDDGLRYVSHYDLPKEVLPASGCLYISRDYRIFVDKSTLKLYSIGENKVVGVYEGLDVPHFGFFHKKGFYCTNGTFYVSTKNDNVFYELFIDGLNIGLKPVCKFDFGDANFDLLELPKGETDQYYLNYAKDNSWDAFVDDKYVDGDKRMCFFTYAGKSYFAYQDQRRGFSQVYYNIPMAKQQFLPANLYMNKTFYYVCEPQYLHYVIDESLMSSNEMKKMASILEDDNPIIVCYKLK